MKRILITGKNSYVGNSLETWLLKQPDRYQVDKISLRDNTWRDMDFSPYDVVVHVAGIAHQKETKKNASLYYQVNRDLAFEVARKSKLEKVKQFIHLSSMSVYGLDEGIIDQHTPLDPKTNYGKSKLEAEQLIKPLGDENFKVAILRPPMVYGKDCKGNYQRLRKLALKTPIFPKINNERSMIYIDNLSEFIRLLIDHEKEGLFFPQNQQYVNTSDLVREINQQNEKKVFLIGFFNSLISILKMPVIDKVFGSLVYKKRLSKFDDEYCLFNFKESLFLTEKEYKDEE